MRTLPPRSGKASKGAADWNAQAGQIRAERERFGAPAAGGLTCLTTIMAGGAAPGRKGEISLFG
jgi:hypothetical protein